MTLVIDNLEKRGLVRRERSSEDRRFIQVHLPEAGSRIMSVHHITAIAGDPQRNLTFFPWPEATACDSNRPPAARGRRS